MKTIVISAVNLVEAGTLAILRDCLQYLSQLAEQGEYRIVALVYRQSLVDFPNIEYIETQWPKKRWINRIWYEYVSMKVISKGIGPIYLWFSLHDTSPSVLAERRAVYCHNSFPFYRWKLHDLVFAPKIALFAMFSRYIYQPNIHRNKYLVVQQYWFRTALQRLFNIDRKKIIVAPPTLKFCAIASVGDVADGCYSFIFAGSPNSHKNFEVICRAAEILQKEGFQNFKIHLTVSGTENKYAKWLYKNWGHLPSIHFMGFVSRELLEQYYAVCKCLIYPSKVESWGLPISEFAQFGKPMLLADLPYAHDTANGCEQVSFFDPDQPRELASKIKKLVEGDRTLLITVPKISLEQPCATNWEETFCILLH